MAFLFNSITSAGGEIERGGCLFETMGNVAAEIRRIIGVQRDGNATA